MNIDLTNLFNSKYFDRVFVWTLIIFSFILNFGLSLYGGSLSPDGMQYASLGRNIVELKAYVSDGSHFPDIIQPPLFPLLIALLYSLLRDAFVSGFAVSCIFNGMVIAPLFFIALRLFSRTTAVLSVLLFAVHPLLLHTTLNIGSDSTYYFLFLCVIDFTLRFTANPKLFFSLLIGILVGLAYSARIESVILLIFFLTLLYTSIANKNIPGFKTKAVSLLFLGFFVIYAPLTLFIYRQSGELMFCPKYKLISAHRLIWHESESNPDFRGASYEMKSSQTFFRYDPETKDLLANRLFYKRGYKSQTKEQISVRHSRKSDHKVLAMLVGLAKIFINNVLTLYRQLSYITMFPPLIFPFIVLGFLGKPWNRQRWRNNFHLLWAIFLSFFFLFVNVQYRFLCPAVSLLLLWCAEGIIVSSVIIEKSLSNIGISQSSKKLIPIIIGILILAMIPSTVKIVRHNRIINSGYVSTAEAIKKHVPRDAIVVSWKPQPAYLAQRKYAPLPYLSLDELAMYTTKFKQSAVVLSEEDKITNPNLMRTLHQDGDKRLNRKYTIILENTVTILQFDNLTK